MATVSSFLSDSKEYMADRHKTVSQADTFTVVLDMAPY